MMIDPPRWYRTLSPKGRMVTSHLTNGPCRSMWELLAEFCPEDLLAVVKHGTLNNANLTFAAETLGRTGLPGALPVLGALSLWHRSPVVREGALPGLCSMDDYTDPDATIAGFFTLMARHDNSPVLREMANDSLKPIF